MATEVSPADAQPLHHQLHAQLNPLHWVESLLEGIATLGEAEGPEHAAHIVNLALIAKRDLAAVRHALDELVTKAGNLKEVSHG